MDLIVIKSFLPEIFFSMAVLLQITFNTRLVHNPKFNYPIISKELFVQCFFILLFTFFLLSELNLEGFLSNHLLSNDESIKYSKMIFLFFCLLLLPFIYQGHFLQKLNFNEFYYIFMLSLLSLILIFSTSDLLMFYLLMELQALSFYVLAACNRSSVYSIEGGLKYFISGSFMSGVYLLGVSLIYGSLGTISLSDIHLLLIDNLSSYNDQLYQVVLFGAVLVICTLLFKLACAPFHLWSPDAYEGAPIASTLIFAVTPKFPLVFFLIKFLNSLNSLSANISFSLVLFGILSVSMGTFASLVQKRLKRLIIYSSVAQTGFIVCSIGLGTVQGYTYALFFLMLYLITSILIWGHFIIFQSFSEKFNGFYNLELDSLYLSTMSNFFKQNSVWAFSFVIIFFSIAGIPPLSGFLSKMLVIFGVVSGGGNEIVSDSFFYLNIFYGVYLAVISSVSAYYYIRMIKVAFFEPKLNVTNLNYKIIYTNNNLEILYLVLALLLVLLIVIFYKPTIILLFCEFISLGTFNF
jgi:NADH-quinone oxidoreductase subunit N